MRQRWRLKTEETFQETLVKSPKVDAASLDIVDRNSFLSCKTQIVREITLQNRCRKKEMLSKEQPGNSYLRLLKFSNKGKLIMCIVPKVASRNWIRVFLAIASFYNASLVQNFDSTDKNSPISKYSEFWQIPGIDTRTTEEKQNLFATSYKILFVRNPYEGLVSAYIYKFVLKHDPGFKNFIARLKKDFRNDKSKKEITFKEFIQFVIHEYKAGHFKRAYEHWLPITNICSPCFIRYDFIGKMETLIKNSQDVLKLTKVEEKNLFPAKGAHSWGVSRKGKKVRKLLINI